MTNVERLLKIGNIVRAVENNINDNTLARAITCDILSSAMNGGLKSSGKNQLNQLQINRYMREAQIVLKSLEQPAYVTQKNASLSNKHLATIHAFQNNLPQIENKTPIKNAAKNTSMEAVLKSRGVIGLEDLPEPITTSVRSASSKKELGALPHYIRTMVYSARLG